MRRTGDGRAGLLAGCALVVLSTAACGSTLDDGDPVLELDGATHRFTVAAGVRWHRVEAGAGDPLVLLHGMPGTWHAWAGVIPALAGEYRILAPDLKAMGHSAAPAGDYSFCAVGAELLALLDGLEIRRFRLVGHDWGAMIGACMAAQAPGRVVAYVHVSAPLTTYDLSRLPDYRELYLAPAQAAGFLHSPEVLVARLYDSSAGDTSPVAPRIIARRAADLRGKADGVSRYFRDLDLQAGWEMGPRMRPAWERMQMPVWLVLGDRDLQVPLETYLGAEALIPGLVRVVTIDEAGHFPAEEQPQRLAAALMEALR